MVIVNMGRGIVQVGGVCCSNGVIYGIVIAGEGRGRKLCASYAL